MYFATHSCVPNRVVVCYALKDVGCLGTKEARVGRTPEKPRNAVHVEMPDALYLPLQAEAKRRGISRAAIMRWALAAWIARSDRETIPDIEAIA